MQYERNVNFHKLHYVRVKHENLKYMQTIFYYIALIIIVDNSKSVHLQPPAKMLQLMRQNINQQPMLSAYPCEYPRVVKEDKQHGSDIGIWCEK